MTEEQNEGQKKPILTLAIELGDKKKQLLNIYIDSKPEQLAYDFCLQNNLDFDSMQNLTDEIKNALSNYKRDSNKETKNPISEEREQITSKKKYKQSDDFGSAENYEQEDIHEVEQEDQQENAQIQNEEENIGQNEEHKENEKEPETEEVSEENHEQGENIVEYHESQEKEELQSGREEQHHEHEEDHETEQEVEHVAESKVERVVEHKDEKEFEKEEHLENENLDNKNKNENEENKTENHLNNEKDEEKNENENENENENNENKKEENEEELAKEEEGDEMMDINENDEEDNIPSYLSPTICFQYKQRQIAQPKPKQEFADFDTSYKKIDRTKEIVTELNEEVVTHLDINQGNQKYLPKDYYDNPEGKNFGERLYEKEIRLKEEAMEKIRGKVEMEKKVKDENLTFSPKINDYNLIALQNRKNNKIQYNEEKRILNYKDYLKAKEEKVKDKVYSEMDKENTFMPKINKKSEKMTEGRSTKVPRYEQLYKKKVDLKKLEEKIYDHPFKPKINENYKGVKGTRNKKMAEYASLTFEERQKKFREKLEEKREKLIEQKNTNIDPKSGKKYFNPTINKNKKLDDERKNKPIFNELYSDSTKYKIKKEELEKKVLELEQFNTKFKASERSEEMYDKQKSIAFEKIFKRLDNDKDGQISKDDIDVFGISKRLLKIITPIMDELKKGGGSLSCADFVKKCEKIYVNLNYADKKELFIYSMGGAIKSVYETEPFRRKKVQKKSRGKSLKNTQKIKTENKENIVQELKE